MNNGDKQKKFQEYIENLELISHEEIIKWLLKNGWQEENAKKMAEAIEQDRKGINLLKEKMPELFE